MTAGKDRHFHPIGISTMLDYIDATELSDNIVERLPNLTRTKAIEDAAKDLVDAILEHAEGAMADAVAKAVDDAVGDQPELRLSDLANLTDASGREIGAMVSEAPHLHRQIFLRGLIDGLDAYALNDLHAELARR